MKRKSTIFAHLRNIFTIICFRLMVVGKRSKSLHPRELEKYRRLWYLEILEKSRRFKVKRIPFICWYFVKCRRCFFFPLYESIFFLVYMLIFCKMSSLLFFLCMILYFFSIFSLEIVCNRRKLKFLKNVVVPLYADNLKMSPLLFWKMSSYHYMLIMWK